MVVPLRDQNNRVRYYLGAQLDITELVNGSVGLESLQKLSTRRQCDDISHCGENTLETHDNLLSQFQQLSETFNPQELQSVLKSQQRQEMDDQVVNGFDNSKDTPPRDDRARNSSVDLDGNIKLSGLGSTPPLGFYMNYLLVRPHPSLRILFASQDLRVPGVLQSPLMNQIAGSSRVRDDLYHALEAGQKVTAKIQWLSQATDDGRGRWIHCTPLISASGLIGVWMVILVDDDEEPGVSHEQSLPDPLPTTMEMTDAPEPSPWNPNKGEGSQACGSSGTSSTPDSSQTAVSESARTVFQKVPSMVKEVPETIPPPFASNKARGLNIGVSTNGDKPLPSPPAISFVEQELLSRSNESLLRPRQQEQQQQYGRNRNMKSPASQSPPIRPGPRIAGKAYSFDSEHGLSSEDGNRSINSKGDDRPTSRDSHMTVNQSHISPPDIRWRKPDEIREGPPSRGAHPIKMPGKFSQGSSGSERSSGWKTKKSLSPYGFLFHD
ncbi:MAG: hypothetical protein LQ337_005666 [Flavoplaca oasis]|nr:MAG: hypothetical protein LQ337_005666 [Flavoplaca oasis]